MDTSLKSVRGLGPKLRGYIAALHPELSNKANAAALLAKYPEYEELVQAIQNHDPTLQKRTVGSFRSNLRAAYEYMDLLTRSREGGGKRKRDETTQEADSVRSGVAPSTLESVMVPSSLNGDVGVVSDTQHIESKLESLVNVAMETKPLGETNPALSEGVSNIEQPLPTYAIQQKNYPLTDAVTEGMAIDMAEQDPIKPTKELEFIPNAGVSTLLTIQDENYLETRNSARLLHTTILPAAALVPNDGGGAREGVRRSDNDIEVEEAQIELDKKQGGANENESKGSGGAGGKPGGGGPLGQVQKGESDLTISQMVSSGDFRGLGGVMNSGIDMATLLSRGAMMMGGGINQGAAAAAAIAATTKPIVDAVGGAVKGLGEKLLNTRHIRSKMAAQGVPPDQINVFLQNEEMQQGSTELESKGARMVVDELRPFFPIAGSTDVELSEGDVGQKRANVALFANYKPPNWPLGNMDNQLYFQNLVLQGIHWMSPLDSIPSVLPGGSLYDGVSDFSSQPALPEQDMLVEMGIRAQVEFRMNNAAMMMHKLRCVHAGVARDALMNGDSKFIHNPMALGVDSSMERMQSLMNPLSTPMHRDLRVGGSRSLRRLVPVCDAMAGLEYQIGSQRGLVPDTRYTMQSAAVYNPFGIFPGLF